MTTLVAVYRHAGPWIIAVGMLGWLLPGPAGQQVFLNLGASVFYGAATARALGLHDGWSVPALAVDRAFTHLTALTPLVLFSGLAAAVGATVGNMAASAAGLQDDRMLSMPLAALATLPILWWHWPAAILAYLVPDELGVRVGNHRSWRGPRYGDARRLVRAAGSSPAAVALLALVLLWIAVLVLAGGQDRHPALATAVTTVSYIAFIPVLLTLLSVETLRMMAAAAGAHSGG
jgi:hypothetical protein